MEASGRAILKNPRSCENCTYVEKAPIDPLTLKQPLLCRRHPPCITCFPMGQGIGKITAFPEVMPDMWCHEWAQEVPVLKD